MIRIFVYYLAVISMSASMAYADKIDRSNVPGPSGEYQWLPPEVEIWTLANGLQVWHVQQTHTPLISATLMVPHGSETDPADKAGRASLMVDLLDEGAGGRSALELSDAMQRLAMSFSTNAQTDSMTFSMNILAEKLDESLSVFTDILFRPAMTEADFNRRKAQRIASAITSEANLGSSAFRVLRRALNGQGYLGLPSGGTKSSLERLTHGDIKAAYTELMTPVGAVLVVVGDVDKPRLTTALTKVNLDKWAANGKPPESRPLSTLTAPALHVVDFPGSAQTFVVMARHAGSIDDPDRYDAKVGNHNFAGAFTGRLNLNLREAKGYTYGARGGYSRYKRAGRYSMYAKVKRDTTRPSIDEMQKELADISGSKPLTQLERDNAVSGLLKGFPGQFERGGAIASKLIGLASSGRTPSELRSWPAKIGAVTLENAQKVIRKDMQFKDFVVVVAGDWSKIKDSLADLGLPIVMHRPDGQRIDATK